MPTTEQALGHIMQGLSVCNSKPGVNSGATDPAGARPVAEMLAAARISATGRAPPGSVAPELTPGFDLPTDNPFIQCIQPEFFSRIPVFFSGSEKMSGSEKIVGICTALNLEVLSLPEGLVHSI